ncbi:MAG TPA: DUF4147 domain-containing protein [Gemmatimonadales bacterium]|nr:DUF4147 domain-containing protein [Gemmatimonadales bacterium]
MTSAAGAPAPRDLLTDLYWTAVTAAAPGPALIRALDARTVPSSRPVHLLALGKAALPMATAAVEVLATRRLVPAGGLLVVPEPSASPHPALAVAVGDHPQPGPNSFAASEHLAQAVARVRPGDEVWVLLSGGTTSLIGAPIPGIAPTDLGELYRLLLGSGLDITAMNRIRKRYARWAGGRLAAALAPAHVKNFTISDVIGDDLGSIGSGPCVPDASSAADVRALLVTAGLWMKIPAPLRDHLEAVQRGTAAETPKPGDPAFQTTEVHLVASNRLALEAVCAKARALGLEPRLLDDAMAGEAAEVGRRLASALLAYDGTQLSGAQGNPTNKHAVLVWGGETTVTLGPSPGLGGRSQELALAAGGVLARERRPDGRSVHLLAAGTDGRDGPTDAAGGFADAGTWDAIRAAGRDPEQDLARHESHAALRAGGALFVTGMTGTNVMDLVLGLVS